MEIQLHSNWEFRKAGDSTWMPATVPGCVHTDLMALNSIPDPFYGDNEKLVQWVEREDWEYRTTFRVNNALSKHNKITLNFQGLDTYATIYLNGQFVGNTEDMFVEYTFDVHDFIQKGENDLLIKFESAVNRAESLSNNSSIKYPPDARVWARKAQYQFGWDWGPRLATTGIWKPVSIKAWNEGRINSLFVQTLFANTDSARFFIEYEYELDTSKKIKLELTNITTGEILRTKFLSEKNHRGRIYQTIQHPKLWWSTGLGEQHLYTFELKITKGLHVIDRQQITAGIRTIELVNNPDSLGGEFYFKVNGTPVFIKGANMIPLNSFPSSVSKDDYTELLAEVKKMNMNMIRIWGGGIYENDLLYQLCDSLGILVWQDFMYAGAMYPMNELNYRNTISTEAIQQIRRLRSHPSIALWCGNNEILEGWLNWGWQKSFNYTEEEEYRIYSNYSDWFEINFLSELVAHTENGNNYYPSSPSNGWGRKESLLEGDCHYWGVWWGKEPFEVYNQKIPRFMSEYGFQGMPSIHSFRQFIPEAELQGTAQEVLQNPSVMNHQKHPVGYETIQEYMERDFIIPANFDDYIYVSQLLQARSMEIAIEAHRRNAPYCMGTLFWQLNDCWPVTSWSVLDHYNNRKASYYTVKEKYSDVMVSVEQADDSIHIWVANDRPVSFTAFINYKLYTTSGIVIEEITMPIELNAQSAQLYTSINLHDFLKGNAPEKCALHITVIDANELLATDDHYFVSPKHLELQQPQINFEFNPEKRSVLITSDVLVKNLYLYTDTGELKLSRNFFDLTPGVAVAVTLEAAFPENLPELLRYKCLNNINGN